ncbi:MAG: GDSL-type esterase/lipase family protein [Polyangiaceae bacterium]
MASMPVPTSDEGSAARVTPQAKEPAPTNGTHSAEPHAEEAFGELHSTLRADAAHVDPPKKTDAAAPAPPTGLVSPSTFPVAKKALFTGLALLALVGAPYAHKSLERFRVLSQGVSFFPDADTYDPTEHMAAPIDTVGEMALPGPTDDQQARGDELDRDPTVQNRGGPIARAKPLPIPASVAENKPPISIDDGTHKALDHFFEKLMRVEAGEPNQVVRILYYGDSIVASDFITGKLRRLLQDRFGDAGHGYAIIANAFPGWFHIDVSRKSSDQWKASRCIGPYAEDGLYGLGCVSFVARREGEWFMMGTADGQYGHSASRFELEYLEQPDGGDVDVLLDGEKYGTLSTSGPEKKLKYYVVETTDGAHKVEVKTTTDRPTRLFGMRMERSNSGVTLSALGITGARARFLDKQDDAHWAEVLKAAKPDLVILAFGTNEVGDGMWWFDEKGQKSSDPMGEYERTLKAVMQQVQAAVPESSFMLVGPPDMASNKDEEGHSKAMVPTIVTHQKSCAAELGWAYWNQFVAMGGSGSMWSWVQSGLGNADLIHPTGPGGNVLGKLEYLALMEKYEEFKSARRENP